MGVESQEAVLNKAIPPAPPPSLLPSFLSTLPARARVAGLLPRPLVLLLCSPSLLLEHGLLEDAHYEGRGGVG